MKKIYLAIIAIIICSNIFGQVTYQWAFGIGGTTFSEGKGITIDPSGNVIAFGTVNGGYDFDPGPGVTTIANAFFIAKYTPTGNLIWAKGIARSITSTNDYAAFARCDNSGGIYVTGSARYTCDFDPSAITYNLSPLTYASPFLAKYDTNGNFVWATLGQSSAGSTTSTIAYDLDIDNTNNQVHMVVTCTQGAAGLNFIGSASGAFVATAGNLMPGGAIITFNCTSGAWVRDYTYTTAVDNNVYSVAVNPSNGDYMWGASRANAAYSSTFYGTFYKRNSSGTLLQTENITGGAGTSSVNINKIKFDNTNNYYATGTFNTTYDFDTSPGVFNLSAVGSQDIFLAKYSSSMALLWAFSLGSTVYDDCRGLNTDPNGNIIITGVFHNTVDFDPGAGVANLTATGTQSLFVASYSPSGTYNWAFKLGSTTSAGSNDIIISPSNEIYITGNIGASLVDFDPGAGVANVDGTANMVFVAKYANCTIAPALPGTISGTTTICSGSSNTYSITAVAGATSYTWTLPGGWTGSSTTTSINATASATSGNITVTANNACGASTAQTLAVTVNPIPATPGTISGTATICSGSSNTYSITAVAGATSYTWTLPSGWSGTSTTNSINATASATSGNITVTANNTCGNSAPQTLAVVVNTIPATPGTISGTATICSGTTNTYSVTAVAGATSYTWTLPSGWTGTSTTNSINATASATSGNITVTANNTCGNSSAQTLAVTVNSIPPTPGTISGTTTICSGTINTYSITAVAGATSYTWTLPGGWTGTSTTNSINATASATSGNITVTANNTCGNSTAATLAITVNPIPATPVTISGLASMCIGTGAQTYSITAVGGATSYTWTLPATWSGTSTTNSIVAAPGTSGGNITVTANNTCGNSSPQTLAVIINPLPVVTYSQSPSLVCINATSVALGTVSPAGGIFTGTAVTGSTFNATTAGTGTFNITYTYTDGNGCVNSAISSIVVDPCTGISQNTIDNKIVIYPNPTTSIITVSGVDGEAQITLYNVLGKIALTQLITKDKTEIDLSKETNGVYFIKIITENNSTTKKIIKQ